MASAHTAGVEPERKYRVFLSSFSSEDGILWDDRSPLRWIRERAAMLSGVYVAEQADRGLEDLVNANEHLAVVDTLLEELSQCEHLICILGGARRGSFEHGTPIAIRGRASATTYFEIELFQAAVRRMRTDVLILKGFDPGPRLLALLKIVGRALPVCLDDVPREKEEILRLIENVASRQSERPAPAKSAGWLAEEFFADRVKGLSPTQNVLFLGGETEMRSVKPDKWLIEELLNEYEMLPDMQRRMSRLWIAARELMSVSYLPGEESLDTKRVFLPFWNRVLGHWWGCAAWSGLHVHIFGSTIAALNSQTVVREELRNVGLKSSHAMEVDEPVGPLASAYYSLAKTLPNRTARKKCFALAMDFVQRGILKYGDNDPYLYCVAGSIFFQNKSVFAAVRSYERARNAFARIRPESEMGDVLSELGFAYCFSGSFVRGRRLLEHGVKLLDAKGPSGFLIRARRKLSIVYKLSGKFSAAADQKRRAIEMAKELKMFDQLSQLQ
jgi:hypothetical protein